MCPEQIPLRDLSKLASYGMSIATEAVSTALTLGNDVVDPRSHSRKRRRSVISRGEIPPSGTRPQSGGVRANKASVNKGYPIAFIRDEYDGFVPKNVRDHEVIATIPCNKQRCSCCHYIDDSKYVTSNYHRLKLNPINCEGKQVDCSMSRIVYLITCKKCSFQYIGETTRKLSERMREHVRNIKQRKLHTFMVKHFNDNGHTIEDFSVKIVEHVDQNDLITDRELFWIKTLNTAYPFGLNDNIKNYGTVSEGTDPLLQRDNPYLVGSFMNLKRRYKKRRRKSKKVDDNVCQAINNFNADTIPQLVRYLRNRSQKTLRLVHDFVQTNSELPKAILLATKCFLARYYHMPKLTVMQQNNQIVKIKFIHPVYDAINIPSILNATWLKRTMPTVTAKDKKCKVVFSYEKPFSAKVLNHSKVLSGLRSIDDVKQALSLDCHCQTSEFRYHPAGHIVTGNLNIVNDHQLREVLKKGTKYRLPVRRRYEEIVSSFKADMDACIQKLSGKYKKDTTAFRNYYNGVLGRFQEILRTKLHGYKCYKSNVFNKALVEMQKNFVICPADKAAGNYVFVCKRYYIQTICNELGIDRLGNLTGNETYTPWLVSAPSLAKKHHDLETSMCLVPSETNRLPKMYGLPKLHKEPYKFRFIAAATNTTTTKLSIELHRLLTVVKDFMTKYCRKIYQREGRRMFWSIDNSYKAAQLIKNYNISNLTTADFSTLFTKLPHEAVREAVYRLLDIVYKNNKYIATGEYRSFTCNEQKYILYKYYDVNRAKSLIDIILDESYVVFAGHVFKQVKGIPMGGNASPLLADLTLASMEYSYMQDNKFANIIAVRYIDDILVLNDNEFINYAANIYGSQLALEVTHAGNECCFLDLHITTHALAPKIDVYNKTDAFPFTVNRYGYADSCISIKTHSGVIVSQLIRFARIHTDFRDFTHKAAELVHTYKKRGFDNDFIVQLMRQFVKRNRVLLTKFVFPSNENLSRIVADVTRAAVRPLSN